MQFSFLPGFLSDLCAVSCQRLQSPVSFFLELSESQNSALLASFHLKFPVLIRKKIDEYLSTSSAGDFSRAPLEFSIDLSF